MQEEHVLDDRVIDAVLPGLAHDTLEIYRRFSRARPFPHVVIDGFFEPSFGYQLLADFPDPSNARRNEFGAPGAKAFHSDLTLLGRSYRRLHNLLSSPQFLRRLESATGIDGLLYDEGNFGGGTHENFDGRDLLPHIDFNIHPVTKYHRRVNLIIYLNLEWDDAWGGAIDLHRDPRDPLNEIVTYSPTFNRAVIFETSERSWHGFRKLTFPPGEKHRSRKSLSFYFYTRERPPEEVHAEHTTFFVPRSLPSRYVSGYCLTDEDSRDLGELVAQRDRLITLYQHQQSIREPSDSAEIARLRIELAEIRSGRIIPTRGPVRAFGPLGRYPDGWYGDTMVFGVEAQDTINQITFRFRIPQGVPTGEVVTVQINGSIAARTPAVPGYTEVTVKHRITCGDCALVRIHNSATANPKNLGLGEDERDLGIYFEEAEFG